MDQVLEIEPGAGRDAYLPLLDLADVELVVRTYYQRGDLFAFLVEGVAAGVILVLGEDEIREFKAVAVAESLQGQGVGRRMMRAVMDELRARGVRRVELMTGTCGIGQIAFYQKVGMRMTRIERDRFTAATGYPGLMYENGIRLRDAVWFDIELT